MIFAALVAVAPEAVLAVTTNAQLSSAGTPARLNTAPLGPLVRVKLRERVPPGALAIATLSGGQLRAAQVYDAYPSDAVSVMDDGAVALVLLAVMLGAGAGVVTWGWVAPIAQ